MSDTNVGVLNLDSGTQNSIPCSQDEANAALKAIHASANCQELCQLAEDYARNLSRAGLATIFILQPNQKVQSLLGFRNKGKDKISFPVGEGIAGMVAQDNGFYICSTPDDDSLFENSIDGVPGVETVNLLSVAASIGDEVIGVLQVANKMKGHFTENDAYWIQTLADHVALAYQRLRRSEDGWDLVRSLAETFSEAVDAKHVSTVGHSDRTRQIALGIAKDMRLSKDELIELELASLLHDVGRLAMSPEAFDNDADQDAGSGFASPGETLHLVLTESVLKKLTLPHFLESLQEIALSHHEKADGSGYPKGKRSADLPLSGRILAVANAYDLLTSGRARDSKGKPMSSDEAIGILKMRAGQEFDPAVVERLVRGKAFEIEKRRYPRYDYSAPLEIEFLSEAGNKGKDDVLETEALNLSEGGLLFRSEHPIKPHALLNLEIHLPTETLTALARVARTFPGDGENDYKIGAYFLWFGTQETQVEA